MAKIKPLVSMQSYGIYTQWDSSSKELPQIQSFTTKVPAKLDIEFGFIINIKKAKGEKFIFVFTTQISPMMMVSPWLHLKVLNI